MEWLEFRKKSIIELCKDCKKKLIGYDTCTAYDTIDFRAKKPCRLKQKFSDKPGRQRSWTRSTPTTHRKKETYWQDM